MSTTRTTPRTPVPSTPLREKMRADLQIAGLSERSQEAYLRAVRQMAEHFHLPPDQITEAQLRQYFLFLKNEKRLAPASLKIAFYGIAFFYCHTAPREWPTLKQLRIPPRKTLPEVLTRQEVPRLIEATRTLHNRTYFWTLYSLGLRLTEGLFLQVGDIDSARKLVHGHRGKGAKDRYVPLPPRTLVMLRTYWSTHRHPLWLFPAVGRDQKAAGSATHPMPKNSVLRALLPAASAPSTSLRPSCRHCGADLLLIGFLPVRGRTLFDTS